MGDLGQKSTCNGGTPVSSWPALCIGSLGSRHMDLRDDAIDDVDEAELLAPELKGEQRRDIRSTLAEDAPALGAIPIEVNA